FGDCLGAVVVLLGIVWLGFTASQISVVTIVLLLGWLGAAWFAQREYVDSLRASIYEHRIDAERLSTVILDRSTADVLSDALRSDDPEDILYALGLLDEREKLIDPANVRRLLDHRSAAVRKKAVAVLAAAGDLTVLQRVEQLLGDEDAGVRAEALMYLTR